MVHFEREQLLNQQLQSYNFRKKEVCAWAVIGNIAWLIVSLTILYFISTSLGMLIESLGIAATTYCYIYMSHKTCKIPTGKYLKYDKISVAIEVEQIVLFLVSYDEKGEEKVSRLNIAFGIVKRVEQTSYNVIFSIRNGGVIKLPYSNEFTDFYAEIQDIFGKKYKIYK